MESLTSQHREVLLFESTWRPGRISREEAIRERFGFSSNTYLRILDEAVRLPGARVIAPAVVTRRLAVKRRRDDEQAD